MKCWLYSGRSAQPIRRPTCFHGPARATAHDRWCTDATTMTTSTRPMRRPTLFRRPARATAHDMWCTEKQKEPFSCFCILHLAKRTNSSKQQLAASYTAKQTVCATKHAAVAAARGQDLRIRGRIEHTRRQWLCVNQLPHSHIAVCVNSRARYEDFHVWTSTYARSRNLRPCVPHGCAEAPEQQITQQQQRAAAVRGE